MTGINRWMVMVGVVGTTALVAAGWLLWVVLTRPTVAASLVQRVLE